MANYEHEFMWQKCWLLYCTAPEFLSSGQGKTTINLNLDMRSAGRNSNWMFCE